jgi:CBS domain containing-hemolysin-like protein
MLLTAFFSGIETGVVSIHRLQLEHLARRGDRAAILLKGFLDNSDRLFGTTLVGTNLGMVIISVLSARLVRDIPGQWAEVVSTFTDTALVLIFSEYIPKAWFHTRALARSRFFADVLRFFELALKPIAVSVVWVTTLFVPKSRKVFPKVGPSVTKEDFKMLLQEGEKDGILSSRRTVMIHNVLELAERTARHVMIPRDKMAITYSDTPIPEFLEIARKSEFTRFPVLDRQTQTFSGIVNVFFVVSEDPKTLGTSIAGFIRKPLFIPETMPVEKVLPLMRRSRQPMCFVTGKNSEVLGLITTEDIVQAIVGKL